MIDIPSGYVCTMEGGCACQKSTYHYRECAKLRPVARVAVSGWQPAKPSPEPSQSDREARAACGVAFERVKECVAKLAEANSALETDARSAKLRRMQRNAFSELSQAQYTLEMSFDRVSPRIE